MKTKSNAGGARMGAGRKKSENKKEPVTLYVSADLIKKIGDRKSFISACYELIENNM